jgi:cob(I)alamin adenosyltransferase
MLYTGKGDNGTTKLFGCTERILKSEAIIAALGTIDELNSYVGLGRAYARDAGMGDVHDSLLSVQEDLFVIQAQCAGAPKSLDSKRLASIVAAIALVEEEIPPIRSFTIPGSTVLSAALDVARTVARRAERSIVAVEDEQLRAQLIPYLNRLSSLLFAYARLAAFRAHAEEKAPSY